MRHRRMRKILEGPLLLTDDVREPRWGAGDRGHGGASLPEYPADVNGVLTGAAEPRTTPPAFPSGDTALAS